MSRFLTGLVVLLSFGFSFASADPIKKDKIDHTKLAKEHLEEFWKKVLDSKMEDALKMMDLPFMTHDGKLEENHKQFEREFGKGPPPGTKVEVADAVELKDLNAYLKKINQKELDKEKIEAIQKHIGENGRVVALKVTDKGKELPFTPFMMVKFNKENKPLINGVLGQ